MTVLVKRFSMWSSGASSTQFSRFVSGEEIFWSSSARSACWNAGYPAKPSFCTSRATVGVETPADSASAVIDPSPDTG